MVTRVSHLQGLGFCFRLFSYSLFLYDLALPSLFSIRLVLLTTSPSHSKVDGMGRHGMEDFAKSSKPIQDARRLKVFFDNEPNREDEIEPAFNAESYAGAATELWAQKFGKKDFIPPKRGYKT